MKLTVPTKQHNLITPSLAFTPEVVVTFPFQPVFTPKAQLENCIKDILTRSESYLLNHYTMQQALPVLIRLQNQLNNLNYYTQKKSVAIFVSPVIEKTIYLNFEVEDHVMIDQHFKLADIALYKKEVKRYLLLVLQGTSNKLYLGKDDQWQLLKENKPASLQMRIDFFGPELQEHLQKVNTEMNALADKGLSLILSTYPYPLIVMGEQKIVNYFRRYSANRHFIAAFNYLPYGYTDEALLGDLMQVHLEKWPDITHQLLLKKIEKARTDKKLTWGPKAVCKSGASKNSLLVIENGYAYPSRRFNLEKAHSAALYGQHLSFYITDVADELAEKTLDKEGDIILANNGSLRQYDHLVMINR